MTHIALLDAVINDRRHEERYQCLNYNFKDHKAGRQERGGPELSHFPKEHAENVPVILFCFHNNALLGTRTQVNSLHFSRKSGPASESKRRNCLVVTADLRTFVSCSRVSPTMIYANTIACKMHLPMFDIR